MNTYKDSEGTEVKAVQLSGPMVAETPQGEFCHKAGEWLVHLPDGRGVFFTNEAFVGSFTEVV